MGLFDWLKARPKPIPPVRLTVFCTEELLPCPLQIAHPDGLLGALVGIPRASDGDPQSRLPLETSMVAGSYAFAGVSGTVSARVSKRCPGEAYPGCDAAGTDFRGLGEAERSWLASSLWAVRFEVSEVNSGETEVVLYLAEAADRLGVLASGVVLDEVARRYYLPGEWQFHSGGVESVT
jgi:hypothetical protein